MRVLTDPAPKPTEPVGLPKPVPFRATGFRFRNHPVVAWSSVVLAVLVWHIGAKVQDDSVFLPRPGEVLEAFVSMWQSGELALHVAASARRLLMGWGLGAASGFGLGLAIALNTYVRAAAVPLISALFATPKIALLPLFIVWFGLGESAKVATIAIGVFSPMVVATYSGLDGVDRRLVRMAQSFNVPTFRIVTSILLPGALPALLTGVRVSGAIAIVLLVGAEMIAARYGIGALAISSGSLMRTDRLFVALTLLGLCGVMFSLTVSLAESILLKWR